MAYFLSKAELDKLQHAEREDLRSPIPTRIISNGEFDPLPQTEKQGQFEARIQDLADTYGRKLGMDRREFLRSSCGMAAAFLALNDVFGPVFTVDQAEAADPDVVLARAEGLKHQFIFDAQTHFVRDDFMHEEALGLRKFAGTHWNPSNELLDPDHQELWMVKFENYVKEIFVDSDTDVALLSGAPFDDPTWILVHNDQMVRARNIVNSISGARRMLSHAVLRPTQDGWEEEVDEAIEIHKPDAWKMYTIGYPFGTSNYPWRLDDEKLMYGTYEKMVKAGITNVAVHKGLLPLDFMQSRADTWQYATPWDVGKVAQDWPQLNFIIYHSACQPFLELPDPQLELFEQTGEIRWATDLAKIPEEFGVSNVYAELGTVFANCCVTHPRLAAGLVGTLIKGMGADHVIWGQRGAVLRLAAVGNRGHAAPGNPRGHPAQARLRAVGRGGFDGQERHLRPQLGQDVRPRPAHRPRTDLAGHLRADQGRIPPVRRLLPQPQQRRLRLCAGVVAQADDGRRLRGCFPGPCRRPFDLYGQGQSGG